MAESSAATPSVRFGRFEFDRQSRELRRDGTRVRLEGQPVEILALLVERPGALVSREELQQRLWPANRVVDFEHSINTAIKRLREALDDSAEAPRYVETLPRRGYRFIHPVERPMSSGVRLRRFVLPAAIALALLAGLLVLRDSAVAPPQGKSVAIAVLPLKNLSGDPGQDFFADGMTDALITELGKIRALQVLSYHTVNRYRQSSRPLPQIAGELGVDALFEGAVVLANGRMRMTAKLIQPSPERHLWAQSYEFDSRDVLTIQSRVARDVAAGIQVRLTAQEEARLARSRRVDPDIYEAYALGRAYMLRTPTPANRVKSKEYFEQAIAKDPGYAPAYASLGLLYVEHPGPISKDPQDARKRARAHAEKALQLDDTLAEAHTALARIAQQDWDWSRAEREYKLAIEMNPSHPTAHIWYALFLYAMQRFDEAAILARRAQQLDPASPAIGAYAAGVYFYAGRVEEAMASWHKALDLDPSYADASTFLARAHISQGRYHEAIAELRKAIAFTPKDPQVLGALAFAYARTGQRKEALQLLDELHRLQAQLKNIRLFGIIWAYAGLGDEENAFAWLEKAYEERRDRLVWLNVDPMLQPLRGDARFKDLVRRMKLPTRG